jgi:hypothetical protein
VNTWLARRLPVPISAQDAEAARRELTPTPVWSWLCAGHFGAYVDPFEGEEPSTDPARDAANHRHLARAARRMMGEE